MQKIFAVFDDDSANNNSSEQQSKCCDITEEESLQALHLLLEEFEGIFDLNDTSPAHLPPIHVDMKEEYKSKRFTGQNHYTVTRNEPQQCKKTDQSREG
jgi:hypothetical protein